ncbi:hypothetical protein DID75_04955 [Candidatus Marinamargulisbacteria bacterium SCGC AG-410-N11]|nr:hypothetical protein DID75_04955 [Candidatus Marinamargulisbacteria bacterium SCGC AG-410-N11]
MKQTFLAILLTGVWMNLSEFIRNELLFKSYWVDFYTTIGLPWPSAPINGAVWCLWSFLFSVGLIELIKYFSILKSSLISWGLAYALMWIVLLNLGVMPKQLLIWAIPWSFIQVLIAAKIGQSILGRPKSY